jgi:hypothetical protein
MRVAPKPKELKFREDMVDAEFMGNQQFSGQEDRPVTHKESTFLSYNPIQHI